MPPIGAEAAQLCVAAAGSPRQHAEKVLTAAVDHAHLTAHWLPDTLTGVLHPADPAAIPHFLPALACELAAHNTAHPRLRLRVAVHLGTPAEAQDLLTAPPLADTLDEAPDANLVVLLSDRVGTGPIPAADEIRLRANVITDRAWLWVPGWRSGAREPVSR